MQYRSICFHKRNEEKAKKGDETLNHERVLYMVIKFFISLRTEIFDKAKRLLPKYSTSGFADYTEYVNSCNT